MAIDPKKLPKDPEILQQIVVDLTRQLDKSQRLDQIAALQWVRRNIAAFGGDLLQQLLITRNSTRSEQLSPDQLRLFAQQVGIELATPETAKQEVKQQKGDDEPPAAGSGDDSEGKKREPTTTGPSEAGTHCARLD